MDVTVYIAELKLGANRYRDAQRNAMKSVQYLEEKHRDDTQHHATNVKQARAILGEIDVRFVSPSTGGINNKRCKDKDAIGFAVAMEEAMNNYESLKKVVTGDVAVLNVVALQTRGMVNKKILGHIKSTCLSDPSPGQSFSYILTFPRGHMRPSAQ